jgi:adenosylhomocysteine nucleosidase
VRAISASTLAAVALAGAYSCAPAARAPAVAPPSLDVVVLVSADTEWRALLAELRQTRWDESPYGTSFTRLYRVGGEQEPVVFFHGGWGKVSAAGSTQYAIDAWKPRLLILLGTCGGLEGKMKKGDILLARRTLIYDVIERMGSADDAIAAYTVDLDTRLVPAEVRARVHEDLLVSADQDIAPTDVKRLKSQFHAAAADWESGAVAFVASHNHVPLIVLKGVSDVVSPAGGEAYGSMETFEAGARVVMGTLVALLPAILDEHRELPVANPSR